MNFSIIKKRYPAQDRLNKSYDTKKLDRVLISFKYLLNCFKKPDNYEKSQRSFK